MYNKKLLSKIDLGKSTKTNPYKKDIIYDPMGQWKYPGQPTRIPSSNITMKGVNYPVLAVTDNGQKKMMQPGKDYKFPGAKYVDEFPQAKKGGSLNSKKYTRSLDGIGSLFRESDLFKKPKSSKKKLFHPHAKYYQDGGPFDQFTGDEPDPLDPHQVFLKNWYENRVFPKELEKARPAILSQFNQSFPPYVVTDKLPADALAAYNNMNNTVELNQNYPKDLQESSKTHELNHWATDTADEFLNEPHGYLIEDNIINPKNINTGSPESDTYTKDNFEYLVSPREVHSRIMTFRELAGFKPNQVITEKDVEDYFNKAGDTLDPDIKDLKNVTKGNKAIVELLNGMALNNTPISENNIQYTKKGGTLLTKKGGAYYDDSRDAWVEADGTVGPNGPATYQKGGESKCPPGYIMLNGKCTKVEPFVTSNKKEYDYRKKMYNDSLNLYKENAKWQPARDKAIQEHIKWTTKRGTVKKSDINKVITDNTSKKIKIPNSYINSLQNNPSEANQWNRINKKIKPINIGRVYAANKKGNVVTDIHGVPLVFEYPVFKKPVQSVVYQPEQKGNNNTLFGDDYNKKYPPIYLSDKNDPRIGSYAEKGNQYLYKKPVQQVVLSNEPKEEIKKAIPTTRTVYINCPPGSVPNGETLDVTEFDPQSPGNYLRTITTYCDPVKEEKVIPPAELKTTTQPTVVIQEVEPMDSTATYDYSTDSKGSELYWAKNWHSFKTPRLNKHFPLGPLFNGKKKHNFSTPALRRREVYEFSNGGALRQFVDGGNPCPDGQMWDEATQSCVSANETTTEEVGFDPIDMWAQDYEEKNPQGSYVYDKKKEYIKKSNRGLNRLAGVTLDNFPKEVEDQINEKYNYNMNSYITDRMGKVKKFNPKRRNEWIDELGPRSREVVANSKYGSKLQPSLWSRSLAGLATLASPFSPDIEAEVKASSLPGLTRKETNEIYNANYKGIPLGGLETFSAGDVFGAATANYLKNSKKDIPNIFSGELMSNVDATDAMAMNPFLYTAAGEMMAGKSLLGLTTDALKPGAKALSKFVGTESGVLSNAYKINPWAFKPNPESAYRMIGGKEGYLDAINSGEIRAMENGVYGDAHFNMGLPLNPNRLSSEELLKAGSPGGYKGPYMVERRWADNAWNKHVMTDSFKDNPEMFQALKDLGKDKDVWGKYGNLETNDNAVRLYKEHWLKGYKEVPKQLPGSPNVSAVTEPLIFSKPQVGKITNNPWQMQEFPGLQFKSTMLNGAVSKIIEPKTGLINVDQALGIIAKESNGSEKVNLIKNALGNQIPKKMDFNDFRKLVQDEIIPLDTQVAEVTSGYGLENIKYPNSIKLNEALSFNRQQIFDLEKEKAKVLSGNNTVDMGSYGLKQDQIYTGIDTMGNRQYFDTLDEAKEFEKTTLDYLNKSLENYNKNIENIYVQLDNAPLENKTLIISNQNKFGIGSDAHSNPAETLGHIHYLIDKETPDIITGTQIQADAFQGPYRVMPNVLNEKKELKKIADLEDAFKKQEDIIKGAKKIDEFTWLLADGTSYISNSRYQYVINNLKKEIDLHKAHLENFSQKSLLDKSHQERYIQELVAYAAKRGDINKVRLPTKETAAKVQSYIPNGIDYLGPETQKLLNQDLSFDEIMQIKQKEGAPNVDYSLENPEVQMFKDMYDQWKKNEPIEVYHPRHKTILKKYSDMPKVVKKLYGVDTKLVKDSKGNSWYEFDIPKSFKEGKGEIKAYKKGGIINDPFNSSMDKLSKFTQ